MIEPIATLREIAAGPAGESPGAGAVAGVPAGPDRVPTDRLERTSLNLEFDQRLESADGNLTLGVRGAFSQQARRLELDLCFGANTGRVTCGGREYEVGTAKLSLSIEQVSLAVDESPREQSGDPLEMALELAQTLNRIACQPGKKSVTLVFESREALAKIAGISGGKFLRDVMSLVQLIERASDFTYPDDPRRDRYVVGIEDQVARGVIRRIEVDHSTFSASLIQGWAREVRAGGMGGEPAAPEPSAN